MAGFPEGDDSYRLREFGARDDRRPASASLLLVLLELLKSRPEDRMGMGREVCVALVVGLLVGGCASPEGAPVETPAREAEALVTFSGADIGSPALAGSFTAVGETLTV